LIRRIRLRAIRLRHFDWPSKRTGNTGGAKKEKGDFHNAPRLDVAGIKAGREDEGNSDPVNP
jgi:hypothetical protein